MLENKLVNCITNHFLESKMFVEMKYEKESYHVSYLFLHLNLLCLAVQMLEDWCPLQNCVGHPVFWETDVQ